MPNDHEVYLYMLKKDPPHPYTFFFLLQGSGVHGRASGLEEVPTSFKSKIFSFDPSRPFLFLFPPGKHIKTFLTNFQAAFVLQKKHK